MSKSIINVDDLGKEIANTIAAYTKDVSEAVELEVDRTAKEVRDEIKSIAPKRTGKLQVVNTYAKGFSVKKDNTAGKANRIIYNRNKPGLVHLLELGHVKRGGKGRVAARPHLQPSYDKVVPKMEKNIERIIKNGGK